MSDTEPELEGEGVSSELWAAIEADVTALFDGDVDIRVYDLGTHIDVRIMPTGALSALEAEHDELTVVPYSGCQMTIRKEQATEAGNSASEPGHSATEAAQTDAEAAQSDADEEQTADD